MRRRAGTFSSGFSGSPAKEEGKRRGGKAPTREAPAWGCAPEGCRGRSDRARSSRTPSREGPAGWGVGYGVAAPIVWLDREGSHPSPRVPGPFVSERGVCLYFVPEHEDKDCPERATYSKQTGQKIEEKIEKVSHEAYVLTFLLTL